MSEVTFIPNEYAAKGVVIGHPETVAAVKAEVDALRARITELTQSDALRARTEALKAPTEPDGQPHDWSAASSDCQDAQHDWVHVKDSQDETASLYRCRFCGAERLA